MSTAARRGRPSNARKHDAILAHARRMFTESGFSGTGMDELADAAGVSKATIYKHFDSKERLFEIVLRDLIAQLPTPAELVGVAPGPLPERLVAVGRNACALAISPLMHDIQRMLGLPMEGTGRTKGAFWRECLAPYQHAVAGMLRYEADAGALAVIDFQAASSQFFSLVASEPFIRMLLGDTRDADACVASQVEAGVATFLRAYSTIRNEP